MAKNLIAVSAIIILLTGPASSSEDPVQFFENQLALVNGRLPQPLSDPELPAPKCGTPVMAGIYLLKQSGIELPSNVLVARPDYLPLTFGSSRFLVHYTDSGSDSAYQASVDTLPADGVPDYINRVSEIFEYVWDIETGNPDSGFLGYNTPLPDNGGGGDNRFDVYVLDLGPGYYGFTVPEGIAGQYQTSSFIELDNNFSGTIYQNRPVDGVRVTAAHEFFHAIQFGYDALEFDYDNVADPNTYRPWWLEASAVWMEEIVYDASNDYLNYLPYFYGYPWMNLGTFSYSPGNPRAYHPYASCVWPLYLTEKYGVDIIKEIWEGCAAVSGYNTLTATNNAIALRSSSLEEAFSEFSIWNYHTGTRANPALYFSEGALFPQLDPTVTINPPITEPISIGGYPNPPEHLAANYIVVQTGSSAGGLSFSFDGMDITGAGWHVSVLGYIPLNSEWTDLGANRFTGVGYLDWYNWNDYNQIVMIPTVSGTTPYYIPYTYTGSIAYDSTLYGANIVYVWPGDMDNNGTVNADDILPLAANWQEVGEARTQTGVIWSPQAIQLWAIPSATFADADGSGRVDIRDFLAICLNWDLSHEGTLSYGTQSSDFDLDAHRQVLETIYNEVKDSNSGPQYEIRIYLENLLGLSAVPERFILKQNYPNPFNGSTSIQFQINERAAVSLAIFNLLGQRIKTLVQGQRPAGIYEVTWDGRDDNGDPVSSGIYFYRMETGSTDITRKMLLIK